MVLRATPRLVSRHRPSLTLEGSRQHPFDVPQALHASSSFVPIVTRFWLQHSTALQHLESSTRWLWFVL